MSLVSTLAKVAVGVVIAKGVGSMIQNAKVGGSAPSGGSAGSGGLFGGPNSPGQRGQQASLPGGLENMMRDVLAGTPAGRSAPSAPPPAPGQMGQMGSGSAGGLGGLLEELAGGGASAGRTSSASAGGGLNDIIGQLSQGGGLGGLAGALGGAAAGGAASGKGGFGDLLNQSLQNRGEPDVPPTPDQEAVAGLMLRAMIQAAKSDGKIDADEKRKITDQMGDASPSDIEFLKRELAAPVDVAGLVRQVPKQLAPQVYAMSVMGITLDNQNEAQYLHQLAQGLGINQQTVNAIHAKLGVPALYA